MKSKLILAITMATLAANGQTASVKTADEVNNSLYPEKKVTAPAPASGTTGGFTARGKTRGRNPVNATAPVTLTETTRTAVISQQSQRALTRGGMRGSINIKANPNAPATQPDNTSSSSYSPPPAVAEVKVYQQTMTAFSNILFELGSTRFADDASAQQVENIAAALRSHPTDRYVIEGHTCDLGDEGKNQTLSLDRAQAVANRLIRAGVNEDQLVVLGFGESDLLSRPSPSDSPAQAEATRAPNRRVAVGRVAQ